MSLFSEIKNDIESKKGVRMRNKRAELIRRYEEGASNQVYWYLKKELKKREYKTKLTTGSKVLIKIDIIELGFQVLDWRTMDEWDIKTHEHKKKIYEDALEMLEWPKENYKLMITGTDYVELWM